MQLFLLFFHLFLVTADKRQATFRNVAFESKSSYYYKYSSKLFTGIPKLADQYSGYELKSSIVFHAINEKIILMKMFNVETGQLHRTNLKIPEEVDMTQWKKGNIEKHLTKPIIFHYENGKVKNFEATSNDLMWSLNIKKSILSLLNLDLMPEHIIQYENNTDSKAKFLENLEASYYGVYEDGVNGMCETLYEIRRKDFQTTQEQNMNSIMNVTKTRNYDNCLVETIMTKDNIETKGCPKVCRKGKKLELLAGYYPVPDEVENYFGSECPIGYEPTTSPSNQYTSYKYNVSLRGSNWIIDEAISDGKITLNDNGNIILAITKQNAFLTKIIKDDKTPDYSEINQKHSNLIFTPLFSKDTDIMYTTMVASRDQVELEKSAKELLDSVTNAIISNEMSIFKKSVFEASQLVEILGAMKKETLMNIYEKNAKNGKSNQASNYDKIMRQLFMDAIPLAGSTAAADVMQDLISNSEIKNEEAETILKTLPENMRMPNREILNSYQQMLNDNKLRDVGLKKRSSLTNSLNLALAKMIGKSCVRMNQNIAFIANHYDISKNNQNLISSMIINHSDPRSNHYYEFQENNFNKNFHENVCRSSDLDAYVKFFIQRFETADNLIDKLVSIKSLSYLNAKEVLKVLEPYVSGKVEKEQCPGFKTKDESQRIDDCLFVRVTVINSLHHLTRYYPKQIKAMVMPVYKDRSENEDIRMTAFSVIMNSAPNSRELVSIASDFQSENSRQIKSLIASALKNAAELNEPCHHHLAQAARKALPFILETHDNKHSSYSRVDWKEYYDDKSQTGAALYWQYTKSRESSVPSSGFMKLDKLFGTMKDNVFTLTFDQQGLDKYITKPGGLKRLIRKCIKSLLETNKQSKFQTNNSNDEEKDRNESVADLKKRLNISTRVSSNPKIRMFAKMYEKSAFYTWDEEFLEHFFETLQDKLSQNIRELENGKSFHYVKFFSPSSYDRLVISDIGMPIITQIKNPIIVSLKVDNAKLTIRNQNDKFPSFNFSAKIELQIMKAKWANLDALDEANNETLGTNLKKYTQINLPFEINVELDNEENSLRIKTLPQTNKKFFHHKTQPRTYIGKEKRSTGIKFFEKLDVKPIQTIKNPFKFNKQIGTQLLGIGLHIIGKTENERYERNFYETTTKSKAAAVIEALISPDPKYKECSITLVEDSSNPVSGYDITLSMNHVFDQERIDISDITNSNRNRNFSKHKLQNTNFFMMNNKDEPCNGNVGRHYSIIAKKIAASSNDEDLKKYAQGLLETTKNSWAWTYHLGRVKNRINLASSTCYLGITVESISSKPIQMAMILMRVQSIDERINLLKVEASVKMPQENTDFKSKYYWLVTSLTYPPTPNEFSFESNSAQDLTATIDANFGIGEKCRENKGVNIQGLMGKVKNQVDNQDEETWFEKQCKEDQIDGKKGSYACEKAARHFSALNKMILNIEYDNVSPKLTNLSKKLDIYLKTKFYHRMEINEVNVNNSEKKIRIETEYSNTRKGKPVLNSRIEKPTEEIFFKQIDLPVSQLPSALNLFKSQNEMYRKTEKCIMMDQAVRTFDNMTYKMPDTECQYVMSMDCSENEQFAVLVNNKKNNKTVTIVTERKNIQVFPPQKNKVKITIDGKSEKVTENEPKLFCNKSQCLKIYLRESRFDAVPSTVVIESEKTDVKVTSDGTIVMVKLGQRYTGKVCGICGNNDRENEKEFEDPQKCIYERAEDFVNSYAVKDSCNISNI